MKMELGNQNNILLFQTFKGLKFGVFLPKGLEDNKGNDYNERNRKKQYLNNYAYNSGGYYENNYMYKNIQRNDSLNSKVFIFFI